MDDYDKISRKEYNMHSDEEERDLMEADDKKSEEEKKNATFDR